LNESFYLVNFDNVAQSTADSKLASEMFDLPPPISGWPTPHITDDAMSAYLVPLYARRWSLCSGFDLHENMPLLKRKYNFKSFDAAVAFLNNVADIARTERVSRAVPV
jgi:hypothetical protein